MQLKIYGDRKSGNCYKIILTTSILKIEHEWIEIDILKNETQTKDFLIMNQNGKVPVLELRDGKYLSESNAIINFLSLGSELIPNDPFDYHKMLEWQFFEQYSHEPYIAVARFISKYLGLPSERFAEYESKQSGGNKALTIMDNHLEQKDFFVGDRISLADISLYSYTHVADEGGFDLGKYPSIQAWLKRIENIDGYVRMYEN
ncbi:glutathione S-transferase family protein [Leptospira sp. GIMC2001]|uniref:glutathione S-transferase family protein n=1 Tax=Leptospira sp. GIMC2001 TaxID=1513297 RepID=UPI002349645C|nr:glutathione S-transferase family protein [Leptospira sp. GIMC2001]WCL47605.1 glutathione S-transferase family protein [Leptospira sp. GIMC2001]